MRVALLVNPAARGGAHSRAAETAAERLRSRGVQTSVLSGGSATESSQLLRAAIEVGADAVAVAGGDGTVNLAIQEVAGRGIPLGIVPIGTGNDFAASLGLHELDVIAAADVIAAGRTRRVDLARVTRADASTAFYGSVLASGFDSRVNDRANGMRWPRGAARYNIAILVEFLALAGMPYEIEFVTPAGLVQTVTGDLVMATVGNGSSYGGGIPICPGADVADGLLDLVLVHPAGRLRLLRLLPRVYRGTHGTVAEVQMHRVRSVRLASPGVTAYADGDPIGPLPLTVDVVPGALTVFAPAT
ncbi:diacylglycerol kinase [Microbacterium timonense]|uniref:diacylglycerol kinase n=1 Tax=Microbacterium timonense TaxID=2086576 RepID=UPI000D0EF55A|nr:diacylglycerol kinase [Microbacterium timonense]